METGKNAIRLHSHKHIHTHELTHTTAEEWGSEKDGLKHMEKCIQEYSKTISTVVNHSKFNHLLQLELRVRIIDDCECCM